MLFQRSKQADCPKSGHQPFHERIFDNYVGEKLSQKLIKSPLMVRHRFEMNVETGRGAEEALRGKGSCWESGRNDQIPRFAFPVLQRAIRIYL